MSADRPGVIAADEPNDDASERAGGVARTNGSSRAKARARRGGSAKPATKAKPRSRDEREEYQPPVPGSGEPAPRRSRRKLNPGQRSRRERLRARSVKRVVRHVDPWSVLLISLGFYACLFVVLLVAGVLLWFVASATGTVSQIEGVIKESFAERSFSFDGTKLFRASFLGGLILVVAGAALNVLLCMLFNLISDLVGGVRVTVIEEESARPS